MLLALSVALLCAHQHLVAGMAALMSLQWFLWLSCVLDSCLRLLLLLEVLPCCAQSCCSPLLSSI